MYLNTTTTRLMIKRKLVTALFITVSVAAFATLGDDGKKTKQKSSSVLMHYTAKNFSLRSNYKYKSNNFFVGSEKKEFITLNAVVTYQKANAAYVVPLKKLPLMGKIIFNPAPQKF